MANGSQRYLIRLEDLHEEPLVQRVGFGVHAVYKLCSAVDEWTAQLESNFHYTSTDWTIRLYFCNENDALAFKLRWNT